MLQSTQARLIRWSVGIPLVYWDILEGLFEFGEDFEVFGDWDVEWDVLGIFDNLEVVGMGIGASLAGGRGEFTGFGDELSFSKSITRVSNLKHVSV